MRDSLLYQSKGRGFWPMRLRALRATVITEMVRNARAPRDKRYIKGFYALFILFLSTEEQDKESIKSFNISFVAWRASISNHFCYHSGPKCPKVSSAKTRVLCSGITANLAYISRVSQ